MARLTHAEFKRDVLQDPEVLSSYNSMKEEFQLISEMIRARKKSGMTQSEIAESMSTSASAISRLEGAYVQNSHSPSISTLKKYAHALGCRLLIKLVPNG